MAPRLGVSAKQSCGRAVFDKADAPGVAVRAQDGTPLRSEASHRPDRSGGARDARGSPGFM